MRETLSFFCISKLSGPELKEFAQKMCANADTWWDSKECRTTQWKCKNYSNRQQKCTNNYIDEFLHKISSTDNASDDLDVERSDSNIDMLID